ncbi:hypothetical protein VaNZ11_002765, partial [Volvox africanus]
PIIDIRKRELNSSIPASVIVIANFLQRCSLIQVTWLVQEHYMFCLPWVLSARTLGSALSQGGFAVAGKPSWSTRSYATQGEETQRAFRRPMRYGSKLSVRDPGRFQRMKAILGYPDDTSPGKVARVMISMLQTMKYLMSGVKNWFYFRAWLAIKL